MCNSFFRGVINGVDVPLSNVLARRGASAVGTTETRVMRAKPQVSAVIRAENEQHDVHTTDATVVARAGATTCRRACRVTQRAQEMLDLRA
jgi:hypothetical protein